MFRIFRSIIVFLPSSDPEGFQELGVGGDQVPPVDEQDGEFCREQQQHDHQHTHTTTTTTTTTARPPRFLENSELIHKNYQGLTGKRLLQKKAYQTSGSFRPQVARNPKFFQKNATHRLMLSCYIPCLVSWLLARIGFINT